MMKKSLRNLPFIGIACQAAHHIFVDRTSKSAIRRTYDEARDTLRDEMSLVVFPEGARTFTGHMGLFRRGAFSLADELRLPVCPLTINGSFLVMPRTRDYHWINWQPLTLTIHKPIMPQGQGRDNIDYLKEESYRTVMSGLPKEFQDYAENPDQ